MDIVFVLGFIGPDGPYPFFRLYKWTPALLELRPKAWQVASTCLSQMADGQGGPAWLPQGSLTVAAQRAAGDGVTKQRRQSF